LPSPPARSPLSLHDALPIFLPSALPMIFAGLRLGAGTALLLLVAAEMIAVESGIGFLVLHAGNLMQTTKLMVGIVVLSILGVLRSEEHTSELQSRENLVCRL